jgi:hypothetical protein
MKDEERGSSEACETDNAKTKQAKGKKSKRQNK